MSDLLAAASLLLTVITILYSLWYPEVSDGINCLVADQPLNNKDNYEKYRKLLLWKTIPLSAFASLIFLINAWDAFSIVRYAIEQYHAASPPPYSAVRTAFVLVVIILAFLAIHTITATIRLGRKVHLLGLPRL